MRWKAPKLKDARIIRRFLILPRVIDGEWRWLESAKIRQIYSGYHGCWIDDSWACDIAKESAQ